MNRELNGARVARNVLRLISTKKFLSLICGFLHQDNEIPSEFFTFLKFGEYFRPFLVIHSLKKRLAAGSMVAAIADLCVPLKINISPNRTGT